MLKAAPGRFDKSSIGAPAIENACRSRCLHGHPGRYCRRCDAWDQLNPLEQLRVERVDPLRALDPRCLNGQAKGQQAIGLESQIHETELHEAANGETAAGEQRERERELRDGQRAAHVLTRDAGRRAAGFLQNLVDVRAGRLPCGRAAEEHARHRRHEQRECEHRDVQLEIRFVRQRVRRHDKRSL